jgi:NAD(P)-dependent dehydrogenase (short-subunit alcohol dehydrogenase family)
MAQSLHNRVALITGATRGIGRAVAKRFALEGATVIAIGRTQGALEELDDELRAENPDLPSLVLVPEDLAKKDRIEQIGAAIFERFGKLDILVGNAAFLPDLSPAGHVPPKKWDRLLAVNLTANWRLLRAFDVLLKQSDAGRAIFSTCSVGRDGAPFWGPYAATKAGLEALVQAYATENINTPVRANLIDPGIVDTELRKVAFPGEDKSKLKRPHEVTDLFLKLALPSMTETGHIFSAEEDATS